MILTLPLAAAATLFLSSICAVRAVGESSVDKTCRGKYGYAPHPHYCHKYLLCIDGKATSYKCFGNSGFDPELGRCVPNAPCCERTDLLSDYDVAYDDLATYQCERPLVETEAPLPPVVGSDDEGDNGPPMKLVVQDSPGDSGQTTGKRLKCDKGFKKFHNVCYKFIMKQVSWKKATKSCHRLGAELVTIKSKGTMNFLNSLLLGMTDEYVGYVWIGLNDRKKDKRYVWSDGSVLSPDEFNYWTKRAGIRNSKQKKCVTLSEWDEYKWVDAVCTERNGFICEKAASKGGIKNKPKKPHPQKVGRGHKSVTPQMKAPNPHCGLFGYDSGNGPPPIGEVIGGEVAKATEFPWQVSLRKNDQHKCGGSLIDGCWVLSAAHCFSLPYVFPGSQATHAVLGDFDREVKEANEENIEIESVHIHPGWQGVPVPTNDVALLKLSPCTTSHTPICLPTSTDTDRSEVSSPCKVSGFGTMDPDLPVYPTKLQELSVPLVDRTRCESLYAASGGSTSSSLITESMLCAGYTDGTQRDSCSGDSGGPLACQSRSSSKRIQLGIVSWGQGCADGRLPAAYSRVASFLGWIRNTTHIEF